MPSPTVPTGSYQHFDEALPLVGRLGVKLRKGPGCIVYSLEQLILAGLLTMDDGRLELYHRRHQDHLGGKVKAGRGQQCRQACPASSASTYVRAGVVFLWMQKAVKVLVVGLFSFAFNKTHLIIA